MTDPIPEEVDEAEQTQMLDSMDAVDRKMVDITEVYPPERMVQVARRYALVAGSSMDLTMGYDFTVAEHRERAWKKVKEEAPSLLIGPPPCA